MNRQTSLGSFLAIATLALVLAGCGSGGAGSVAAAQRDGVRPASGELASGADAVAQPDATTATPTSSPDDATGDSTAVGGDAPRLAPRSAPRRVRTPVATITGVVLPRLDGLPGGALTVYMDIPDRGVSGLEVTATVDRGGFEIEGIEPGALLGHDVLFAVQSASDAGAAAQLSMARAGITPATSVNGEAAVVLVSAADLETIVAGISVWVSFTDSGFVLHGPFEVAFDAADSL